MPWSFKESTKKTGKGSSSKEESTSLLKDQHDARAQEEAERKRKKALEEHRIISERIKKRLL